LEIGKIGRHNLDETCKTATQIAIYCPDCSSIAGTGMEPLNRSVAPKKSIIYQVWLEMAAIGMIFQNK
jgi:hypothetical protein